MYRRDIRKFEVNLILKFANENNLTASTVIYLYNSLRTSQGSATCICIVLYFYSASVITNTTVKNKIKCDATELVRSPRVAFT